MKSVYLFLMLSVFILSGCVVRTYPLDRDRVDQEIGGNRGYLKGQAPAQEEAVGRKTTRATRVFEIELHSPIKFDKMRPNLTEKSVEAQESEVAEEGVKFSEEAEAEKQMLEGIGGNKGFLTQSVTPDIAEPAMSGTEKYRVASGDTLQKIARKFYGTTKKWNKIYDANREILKSPNSLYPGQVIDIPLDSSGRVPLQETEENLK